MCHSELDSESHRIIQTAVIFYGCFCIFEIKYIMIKYLRFLMLFICMTFLYGCPNIDDAKYKFKIRNQSTDSIYFYQTENFDYFPEYLNSGFIIAPNNQVPSATNFSYGKIYVWIFDKNIIDNNVFKDVINNDMYLKRYELTLDDLQRMNWEIVYNGN